MNARPEITAVILAGGQGARIRHLLPECPKPMAPVLSRPFIEWVVRFLAQQGVNRIIISTGYKAEMIAAHFEAVTIGGAVVTCVREHEPLGTAGGFLEVRAHAPKSEIWLVCNGDSLILTSLAPLFDSLQGNDVSGALLGVPVSDASRYGTLENDGTGILTRFAEKRPGQGMINAGVYLLRDALCTTFSNDRPLGFETGVFPELLASGTRLRVVPASGSFLDIGTPETLTQAENFISENLTFFHPPERASSSPVAILA